MSQVRHCIDLGALDAATLRLILDDADLRFYRRFLRNLNRQVRYLRWTAAATRDGVPRLQAVERLLQVGARHLG